MLSEGEYNLRKIKTEKKTYNHCYLKNRNSMIRSKVCFWKRFIKCILLYLIRFKIKDMYEKKKRNSIYEPVSLLIMLVSAGFKAGEEQITLLPSRANRAFCGGAKTRSPIIQTHSTVESLPRSALTSSAEVTAT